MNCPKCQKTELRVVTESEVELDFCKDCGGIWFDNGELQKVIDNRIELTFDKIRSEETPMMMDYKTAMCPVCNEVLKKVPDKKVGGIMLDQCPTCKGIWLDGGEFKRIKHQNIMDKIKNYLL